MPAIDAAPIDGTLVRHGGGDGRLGALPSRRANSQWVSARREPPDRRNPFLCPRLLHAALDRTPRNYGVGSIIHMPTSANDGGERWLIELEFSDDPTPEEIALFFERLGNRLPDSIGDALEWVIRSPHQDETAKLMAAESLPYHDRIVRFSELVEPGVVEVYNEGITAGRLLLVDGENTQLTDSLPGDILLVENVPDFLPPAAALISSSPQTPLAHVNILAQNRGIPNASQAGLLDDPGIRQAARVRAHVIVRASGIDGLEIIPITRDEYNTWTGLVDKSPIAVATAELDSYATVLDLTALSESAVDRRRHRCSASGHRRQVRWLPHPPPGRRCHHAAHPPGHHHPAVLRTPRARPNTTRRHAVERRLRQLLSGTVPPPRRTRRTSRIRTTMPTTSSSRNDSVAASSGHSDRRHPRS